jgi:hypothetical protein
MVCKICFHESTVTDFVSLRNLCEHLYLDAMVRRQETVLKTASLKKELRASHQQIG